MRGEGGGKLFFSYYLIASLSRPRSKGRKRGEIAWKREEKGIHEWVTLFFSMTLKEV